MRVSKEKIRRFKRVVAQHYRSHGRKLPWRTTRNDYRIFVSEIMLQQTQVDRVVPKYKVFLKRFPSWRSLANARTADVLAVWHGLGYNRRALFLKRASEAIVRRRDKKLPKTIAELRMLPGVGPYTAGALLAFAHNLPANFIETNIRRAFIHFFFSGERVVHDREIIPLIAATVNAKNPREWYYALMDYGSMLAKKVANPNRKSAQYMKQSSFEGSLRQLRGRIIRLLIENSASNSRGLSRQELIKEFHVPKSRIDQAIAGLMRDNLIERAGFSRFRLPA